MSAVPLVDALETGLAKEPTLAEELATRVGLREGTPGYKLLMLAVLAVEHGLWDQAIMALEQARLFHPDNVALLTELGLAYQHRRQDGRALEIYTRITEIDPARAAVYAPLGALLLSAGQTELSIQASRIGLVLDPNLPGLYINLAAALRSMQRPEEAWSVYEDLLAREPHHPAALTDSLHLRQHLNRWNGYAAHLALMLTQSYRKGFRVPPFSVLTATDDPEEQKTAARTWVKRIADQCPVPLAPYAPRPAAEQGRRLRIGYLSNDFYNHATALLLVELLELRDQSRFEVIGYSTDNFDDGTRIRNRILSAFDTCYDIKSTNDEEAAKKIKADGIDILVDLKGFTLGARTEIVARHPAPIQVNYLGYPGTMGAPFVDYILADAFVIPRDRDTDFDEAVVRLPDCYQPNDRKRVIWPEPYSRASCGLPEHGFVFCSFNAPYKITPDMFDIWMRLLQRVPGSVLWLLEGTVTGNANLHLEALTRGIAPERVILAAKLPTEKHLARARVADLFLDSFPVTAHTTASDALWSGLPVLTCPGRSFVSRVCGSLLHAIGLPDLIASDLADYEDKAVALATDPAALAGIRARLAANRLTTPLFDSERYTRHYEAALVTMVERMDAGQPVASFDVTPRPRR